MSRQDKFNQAADALGIAIGERLAEGHYVPCVSAPAPIRDAFTSDDPEQRASVAPPLHGVRSGRVLSRGRAVRRMGHLGWKGLVPMTKRVCTIAHRSSTSRTRCEWPYARWVRGTGRFALLVWCGGLTITLWPSRLEADAALADLEAGCCPRCTHDHRVVDLDWPHQDHKTKEN